MTLESLIIAVIIGAVAGWLAGQVLKGRGFGFLGNLIVGLLGGLVGGWLFPRLGLNLLGGYGGSILNSFLGALILLILIGFIPRKS